MRESRRAMRMESDLKPEFSTGHHNHITFPCTSCGSASEVAVKPFLPGGALQVSFALRVLSPPFTARHNQANEIARVLQLSPIGD